MHYLYHISNLSVFLVLSFVFVALSLFAVYLVHLFIPLRIRREDNGVIGNISALLSIIYGVLVGLTALHLINNIGNADTAVQLEANSVANIYRESKWLKPPANLELQAELKNYLETVINTEWPLMKSNQDQGPEGKAIVGNIFNILGRYKISNMSEQVVIQDLLTEVKNLRSARQQRIHFSYSELSSELWFVIFLGTILTIGINYLYGMNFYLHLLTITAAALMASSMVFLIVTIDRPFQGEFVVTSDVFKAQLNLIKQENPALR